MGLMLGSPCSSCCGPAPAICGPYTRHERCVVISNAVWSPENPIAGHSPESWSFLWKARRYINNGDTFPADAAYCIGRRSDLVMAYYWPTQITVPIRIDLSSSAGVPVGQVDTSVYRFLRFTSNINTITYDVEGPPWHLEVEVTRTRVASNAENSSTHSIGSDSLGQPKLFVAVNAGPSQFSLQFSVTLFPVGLQRFSLTRSAVSQRFTYAIGEQASLVSGENIASVGRIPASTSLPSMVIDAIAPAIGIAQRPGPVSPFFEGRFPLPGFPDILPSNVLGGQANPTSGPYFILNPTSAQAFLDGQMSVPISCEVRDSGNTPVRFFTAEVSLAPNAASCESWFVPWQIDSGSQPGSRTVELSSCELFGVEFVDQTVANSFNSHEVLVLSRVGQADRTLVFDPATTGIGDTTGERSGADPFAVFPLPYSNRGPWEFAADSQPPCWLIGPVFRKVFNITDIGHNGLFYMNQPGDVPVKTSTEYSFLEPCFEVTAEIISGNDLAVIAPATGEAEGLFIVTRSRAFLPGESVSIRVSGGGNERILRIQRQPVVPDAPFGLTATRPSCDVVALSWSLGFDGGTPITTHDVERRRIGSSAWESLTGETTATTFTATGLFAVGYDFRVRARNAIGASAYSGEVRVGQPIPAPSTLLVNRTSCSTATVQWTAPPQEACSQVANYRVEFRSRAIGGFFPSSLTLAGFTEGTSFTLSDLVSDRIYQVRVGRRDAAQAALSLALNDGDYTPLVTFPGPVITPTNVQATPGDTQVALTWDAPHVDSCHANTQYRVRYTRSDPFAEATVFVAERQATIQGLDNGVSYTFRVRAENAFGTSQESAAVLATPSA